MTRSRLVIPEDAVVAKDAPGKARGGVAPTAALTREARDVAVAGIEVFQEALKTFQSLARLIATNKEWNARLELEAKKLEQARHEAAVEHHKLTVERQHLDEGAKRAAPFIDLAHGLVRELRTANLPSAEKSQRITQLIDLAEKLAALGK